MKFHETSSEKRKKQTRSHLIWQRNNHKKRRLINLYTWQQLKQNEISQTGWHNYIGGCFLFILLKRKEIYSLRNIKDHTKLPRLSVIVPHRQSDSVPLNMLNNWRQPMPLKRWTNLLSRGGPDMIWFVTIILPKDPFPSFHHPCRGARGHRTRNQ